MMSISCQVDAISARPDTELPKYDHLRVSFYTADLSKPESNPHGPYYAFLIEVDGKWVS